MSVSDTLVYLQHVTKKYGHRNVLSNISLRIDRGESIIIMGGNGSGKSTLLRLVSGLIPATTGKRIVESTELLIGYVPDRMPKLKMTSTEYLTHMGGIARIPKQQLQERIKALHLLFNLEQSTIKMNHFSKGMLQKVNIMQATLRTPDLLVLDEPFSGLDKDSIAQLMSSLLAIQAEGASIIAAIHDPLLVRELESRTYWIHQGQLIAKQTNEKQPQHHMMYEFNLTVDSKTLSLLTSLFPDATYKQSDDRIVTFTIVQQDYRGFMLELLKYDLEINSLQRKDIQR